MTYLKYIVIYFVFTSTVSFSQVSFTSIDSLLTKNFNAVNERDTASYLSLLNKPAIFKNKKTVTKSDSLLVLQPFTESFSGLIASLADMTADTDFTVVYNGYEVVNRKASAVKQSGKLIIHVNLLLNNSFIVRMPFVIMALDDNYFIEHPMSVMFLNEKE